MGALKRNLTETVFLELVQRCISPEESENLALHMSRDDLAQTFLFADDDYCIIHFVLAQSVNRGSAVE